MRRLLALVLGIAGLAATNSALAGTATTSLGVTVTVPSNCVIATSSVAFGSYDPLIANLTTPQNANGAVSISCTQGTASNITLDLGGNPNGTTRRMRGGGSYFIAYELYMPTSTAPGAGCSFSGATVWGMSGMQVLSTPPAPSRAPRNYNVCGQIPAAQDVPAAAYADSVLATVNF